MCLVVIKMDYVNFRENFERMISTSLGFQNYKTFFLIISPQKKIFFVNFRNIINSSDKANGGSYKTLFLPICIII